MKSRIINLLASTAMVLFLITPISTLALAPVTPKPADFSTGCLLTNNTKTFSAGDTTEAPRSGGQAFRPTTNRITKITAYMEFSAINKVKLLLFTNDQFISESPVLAVTNETGYTPGQVYPISYNLNATVNPGQEYSVILFVVEGTANWKYIENNGSCDPTGTSRVNLLNAQTTDMTFMVQGYNYVPPSTATTNTTVPTATTKATAAKTTAAAPVVAASVLAVPMNFKVQDNEVGQLFFSWDKNKEADLAGYVLYFYEAKKETELEIIDVSDKDLDNYNISLLDHPLMKSGTEYDVKLAAKNTAGAVSQKTLSLRVKFPEKSVEVAAVKEKNIILANPYVLGGLGLLLLLLIGLLTFLEKKYHGLANLPAKLKKNKATKIK